MKTFQRNLLGKLSRNRPFFANRFFNETSLENSRKIGRFFREFVPKSPAKFDFFFPRCTRSPAAIPCDLFPFSTFYCPNEGKMFKNLILITQRDADQISWPFVKRDFDVLRILNLPIRAQPPLRILNLPFAHNHNSLRIPLRILNLSFAHNHNTLRLIKKVIAIPYNVISCWLESCLARSLQAHSLRQQLFSVEVKNFEETRSKFLAWNNQSINHFYCPQWVSLGYYKLINSYSSRTRRIWADIYNQRGRRPSWLLSAHIRQVREE